MQEAFMQFIEQFGYIAVMLLIMLENVFPPIPSEVILPLAGFCAEEGALSLPLVIVAATIGSVAGAFILYGVGRALSRERLMRFFDSKPMRLLGFKGVDVLRALSWFDRRGQVSVLLCRCVPVIRSLISIPAGSAQMHPAKFALFTLIGSAVWNTVLCSLGAGAGAAWHTVSEKAGWVSDIVGIVLVIVVIGAAIWWVFRRIIPNIRERKNR